MKIQKKVRKKTTDLTKRTQIEAVQMTNMFNTVQKTLLEGYSDDGWTLISRIQKNLAGFLFQKEREDLSGLISRVYAGLPADQVVSEIQRIKNSANLV